MYKYKQIFDYLTMVRAKRISRSYYYFKGYIDACFDAGAVTEGERDKLYFIFEVKN